MSNVMELDHTHFKRMKKILANIEKEWGLGAVAGVKDELKELNNLARDIERVIKNQLYSNLHTPAKDQYNGEKNDSKGRGVTQTP